ncbi:alpha/beta fold hydrolase [Erythrobacter sp. F6033]|uniref:alpha/beta fold hydrolase n=1 Tax=Erythrobacter sp. F6033 TaxID=2926401 RepID=UPI001FF54D5D|nr:alpha/beta fold hydrolase [Erythrobacter sp. F6033]MCK0129264.1 LuxR C-terminal-related transcriptional regulator [Erythrobacter sp. F6033]
MSTNDEDHVFDAIKLIEKTYAATLEPEQLVSFETFWESYLDTYRADPSAELDQQQIDTHIMLALDILKRVDHSEPSRLTAKNLVEGDPGETFIMNAKGAIVAANDRACAMIDDRGSVFDLELDTDAVLRLQSWIKTGNSATSRAPLFVHSHLLGSVRKNCLFVTPVALEQDGDEHFLVSRINTSFAPEAFSSIRETYDLSSAEADVAKKLAGGMSPAEVAEDRGASIHTVRTQIKNLLKKTDTRNISDLVGILSGISARLGGVRRDGLGLPQDGTEDGSLLRKGSMTLADGRRFEFFEQGHPNGFPVMFLHSLITDVGLSRSAARQAVLAGLRFITPIRAGYGNSDPNPQQNLDVALDNAAADLKSLSEHLGIGPFVIVSGWAACFAQRFALRHPELVSGMLLLRCVPLWDDGFLESIRPRYRNIVKSSIHLPKVVPYLARLGKVLMDTGRELTFARGMNRERPRDIKSLDDPEIIETVSRSYHCISQQGVDTFVAEMRTIHHDWADDARNSVVPTTVIVEDDFIDFPERAFDRYLELATQTRLRKVKDAGEYLYLTHFDIVLDEIARLRP